MQKVRNWQDSFDRLEASRRDEQQLREAEERQTRLAEAAYSKASLDVARADETTMVEKIGFMLADAKPDQAEALVKPKPPAKSKSAKSGSAKSATVKSPGVKSSAAKAIPRKRAESRRTARVAKPKTAKPKAAEPDPARPKVAGTKVVKPSSAVPQRPESLAPESHNIAPPTSQQPSEPVSASPSRVAAEPLLITPLPRHAALAPYRKPGLFGLIGSWLRLAARRPKLPEKLRRPARKDGQSRDDLAALRSENKQLRRELDALKTLQEVHNAEKPPWATTPLAAPSGDGPERRGRPGGIRR